MEQNDFHPGLGVAVGVQVDASGPASATIPRQAPSRAARRDTELGRHEGLHLLPFTVWVA